MIFDRAVYRETVMQQRQVFKDGVATYVVEDILHTIDNERGLSRPKSVDYLKKLLKARVQQLSLSQFVAGINARSCRRRYFWAVPIDFNSPSPISCGEATPSRSRRLPTASADRSGVDNIRSHGIGQIKRTCGSCPDGEEFKKAKLNWVVSPTSFQRAPRPISMPVERPSRDDFMDVGPGLA